MKKIVAKKLFDLGKTPIGDLIVGFAFGKFSKLLPVKKIKETDKAIAFWHPKPSWENHILIVPKKSIKNLTNISDEDLPYFTESLMVAKEIIRDLKWEKEAYTLSVNGGKRQEVNQLHFHLSSGKKIK